MFGKRKDPISKTQGAGDPMRHAEDRARRSMNARATKVGFFGHLTVDPDQVYVSKEQADRSTRWLEKWAPSLLARRQEKKLKDALPDPAPPKDGAPRF